MIRLRWRKERSDINMNIKTRSIKRIRLIERSNPGDAVLMQEQDNIIVFARTRIFLV